MGSSGNGRFGSYDINKSSLTNQIQGDKTGNGMFGSEGVDSKINLDIKLEDVAVSEYFKENNNIPPLGSDVFIVDYLVGKRLAVAVKTSMKVIGNIPVDYNYLYIKIKSGKLLSGMIKSSGLYPIPYIVVNLHEN